MIYSLDIRHPDKTPIAWLPKVEALAQPRMFEFKPGLNILWGRNGSGKTTVLRLLSMLCHCMQGSVPRVTQRSLMELCGHGGGDVREAIRLKHDGQGVRHFDPGHTVGIDSGAFDDDFFSAGVSNTMFKGSAGQTTSFRFEDTIVGVMRGRVPKVEWVAPRGQNAAKVAEHFLKANAKKGPPTVLLDEPERSLDINCQVGCWRSIRAYAGTTQFIVASHSLFALNIPEANYIDMSPGYLEGCKKALGLLGGWSAEKPTRIPKSELPPEPTEKSRPARKRKESR
jgi:energy-coupling factor transporter ATP-binding protein EcfA2